MTNPYQPPPDPDQPVAAHPHPVPPRPAAPPLATPPPVFPGPSAAEPVQDAVPAPPAPPVQDAVPVQETPPVQDAVPAAEQAAEQAAESTPAPAAAPPGDAGAGATTALRAVPGADVPDPRTGETATTALRAVPSATTPDSAAPGAAATTALSAVPSAAVPVQAPPPVAQPVAPPVAAAPAAPYAPPPTATPYPAPVAPPPAAPYAPPAGVAGPPPTQPYGFPAQQPVPPPAQPYGFPAQQPGPPPTQPYGYPAPPPQNPYQAPPQPAPGWGYGMPAPGYAPPQLLACRICGGVPAADVTVRGHRGLIVLMRFLRAPGPYCVVCGTATVRDMSQQTLLRGWWSYLSSLFTLIALLQNRSALQRLRRLPPPQPGSHGPQLDPGRPLTRRGAIWMLLLPVASVAVAITLLVVALTAADPVDTSHDRPVTTAQAGDCLHDANGKAGADDASASVVVVPCSDKRADYQVVHRVATMDDGSTACAPYSNATKWLSHKDAGYSFVLCLAAPGTIPPAGSGGTGSDGGSGSGSAT
ncbi:hypothetical protein ACFW1A_11750 [Kitasatospora sp. NPDC058965]|uniref:LppU/SCO3897 family protein n=1 Tax=Kitasatospora sp. NPDC058965 TaxID=3346682 RepID=UPI0036867C80